MMIGTYRYREFAAVLNALKIPYTRGDDTSVFIFNVPRQMLLNLQELRDDIERISEHSTRQQGEKLKNEHRKLWLNIRNLLYSCTVDEIGRIAREEYDANGLTVRYYLIRLYMDDLLDEGGALAKSRNVQSLSSN